MSAKRYVDGAVVTQTDTSAIFSTGDLTSDGRKEYMYMLYSGTAAAANGTVCYIMDTAGKLTDDISASNYKVGGVAIGAVARASYGWFQIRGPHTAVKVAADRAISDNAPLFGEGDKVANGLSTTAYDATATVADLTRVFANATEAVGSTSTTIAAELFIVA